MPNTTVARSLGPVSIAVFAYNEERGIVACLDSLYEGGLGSNIEVHVLANGCTDDTVDVVAQYRQDHPDVRLHCIEMGDKTNAWNRYIHDIAPASDLHIFIDGDVQVRKGSLRVMAAALEEAPLANASTALPDSGRNSGNWLRLITEDHGLAGNLYALRGSFVDRLRQGGISLPVGLIGDDSWIGALVNLDLDVARGWVKERTIVCLQARFHYDSFQWYRPRDLRLYWRRRVRYAHRSWQNLCMKRHIHERGIPSLPGTVEGLYRAYPELLALSWSGVDTFFMWLSRRQIRASLRA